MSRAPHPDSEPFWDLATIRERPARVPLFLALLGVVLVVSLAPLAIFGVTTVSGMKDALVTAQQEQQLQTAASISQRLDTFLEQKGREAIKLGEVLGALSHSARQTFLSEFLDEKVVLMRFRPTRGPSSLALAPELVLSDEMKQHLERDAQILLEQGAAPVPASARDAVLSGPHVIGPTRILAVTVSAPVQKGGVLLGVLQELVVVQSVWTEVVSSVPAPTRLFLIDSSGEVFADSRSPGRPSPDVAQREIVRQFLRSHASSRGSLAYDVIDEEGSSQRMLGSYSSTDYGWGVFIELSERLALAPVDRLLKDVAFGGAIAAGLAIVAAFVIGGMISRPIMRLAAISKRLAVRDFSVRAHPSRILELDQLGGGFNTMARKLGEFVEKFQAANRDANNMFLGMIRAFADAIDEKDPYTKGHSVAVNRYAVVIGRYLGLSRQAIRDLHVSSLLHDVGKIGIDDAILKKPAALTDDEFEIMKTHPDRGAKIVSRVPQLQSIIPGLRFHHERWAGGGYPVGLKSEEIPLQARIIAVADTLDAMTTVRPYQEPFTLEAAAARINELKALAFDPEVVEAFNRAYEAGEFHELFRQRMSGTGDAAEVDLGPKTGEVDTEADTGEVEPALPGVTAR